MMASRSDVLFDMNGMSPTTRAYFRRARYGLGVVEHLFQGHGDGCLVAQDSHGQRIADEDSVEASPVGEQGHRVVRDAQHGDLAALPLHSLEVEDRSLPSFNLFVAHAATSSLVCRGVGLCGHVPTQAHHTLKELPLVFSPGRIIRDHPNVSVRFSVKEDTPEDPDAMREVRLRYTAAAMSGTYLDIS